MRWLKLTLAFLTATIVLSAPALTPALAEDDGDPKSPAEDQYDSEAMSTGDIPKTLAGNAADGAGAVNEALDGGSKGSGGSGGSDNTPEKVAGLTMLPETGGAPLVGLCAGVLLSAAGTLLLVRRAGS